MINKKSGIYANLAFLWTMNKVFFEVKSVIIIEVSDIYK